MCSQTPRRSNRRDHIFGVSRNAVLVEVEAVQFALFRYAEPAHCVNGVHDDQRNPKRRQGYRCAADKLSSQHLRAAAVEQALEWSGIVGGNGSSGTILTGGEQAERQSPPNSAETVDRNSADGIVDSEVFEQLNAENDEDAGNSAEQDS